MEAIFLKILNMSITASWLVLAVVVVRLLLKRAPRYISVILWAMVAVRLICPFSFESVLSLIPSAETVPQNIIYSDAPAIESGVPIINNTINQVITENLAPTPEYSANPMQIIAFIAAVVWLVGIVTMVSYTVFSYLRVKRRVKEAVKFEDNILLCDRIDTPFILGVLRPKIYLPSNILKEDTEYVIAHERAHIKRRDHLWKPLGFLILAVYWFNPALWLGYVLLCKDIEVACDQKVLKQMGSEIKKPYSNALINCSVPRKMISACPLAFGEIGVKGRIKSVLNYKKPAFWIVIVAIVTSVAVAVCFLTNPIKDNADQNKPANTSSGSSQNSDNNSSSENSQNVNDDFVWNRDGANTSGLTIASVTRLSTKYPELFNVSTDGGLTVYIWQTSENNYSCFLMNSDSAAKSDQTFAYEIGTTIPEMRTILTTYGIAKENVTVTPVKNPLSSYEYKIDAKYKEKVEKLFWQDENLIFSTVTGAPDNIEEFKFSAVNEDKIKSGETRLPVYKIDSLEKLEEFKTALLNPFKSKNLYYNLYISSFEEATKGFNREFFEKNTLVITGFHWGTGTHRFDVQRLEINNNSLNVHIVETTKAELVTLDIAAWFVMVSVPDTLIKNCTEFSADVNDIEYVDTTIELKQKFPKYFGLDASNGLDLYFWKDSNNVSYCGLLPTKEGGYSEKTLLNLTEAGATVDEMREIIRYYMKKQVVVRKTVTIKFLETSYSDAKDPDNSLTKSFSYSFWFSGDNPLMP